MLRYICLLLLCSCGSSDPVATAPLPDVPETVADAGTSDAGESIDGGVPIDGVDEDTSTAVDLPAVADPCLVNEDCASGWCVEGPDGRFCSKVCVSECPKGWTCKGVKIGDGNDLVFLCAPLAAPVCAECAGDPSCGGASVCASGLCLIPCEGACGSGFSCDERPLAAGGSAKVCSPIAGEGCVDPQKPPPVPCVADADADGCCDEGPDNCPATPNCTADVNVTCTLVASGEVASGDLFTLFDFESGDAATNEKPIGTGTGTAGIAAITFDQWSGALYAVAGGQLGVLSLGSGLFNPRPNPVSKGVTDLRGLAFDASTGVLYAVEREDGPDLLLQIDRVTGQLAKSAFGGGKDAVAITPIEGASDVEDVAIEPATGQLFALATGAGVRLIRVDKATGQSKDVGAIPDVELRGLAFDVDGDLVAIGGKDLWHLDLKTAARTHHGAVDDGTDYRGVDCLIRKTAPQADTDGDGFGDLCDPDLDGDGVANEKDCAPVRADVAPDHAEDCDGVDNDCDGAVDDGCVF